MNRDYNIKELEKHLNKLQENLTEGHTGGCLMIIADALTELNMIKDLANGANTRTEPVLPLQRVNRWAYLYDNWSAIMLGFGIAISFSILLNMIENIVVKIALIIHGG